MMNHRARWPYTPVHTGCTKGRRLVRQRRLHHFDRIVRVGTTNVQLRLASRHEPETRKRANELFVGGTQPHQRVSEWDSREDADAALTEDGFVAEGG